MNFELICNIKLNIEQNWKIWITWKLEKIIKQSIQWQKWEHFLLVYDLFFKEIESQFFFNLKNLNSKNYMCCDRDSKVIYLSINLRYLSFWIPFLFFIHFFQNFVLVQLLKYLNTKNSTLIFVYFFRYFSRYSVT
jgi:hypothetical protein